MLWPKLLFLITIAQVTSSVEETAGVSVRPGTEQPQIPVPVAAGRGEPGSGRAGCGVSLAPYSLLKRGPFHSFRFCGFFQMSVSAVFTQRRNVRYREQSDNKQLLISTEDAKGPNPSVPV